METSKLKRFAQFARRSLRDQVTAKLKLVLADGSAARRENVGAVQALEEQLSLHSQDQVIERVAYTWFNRFCALRFMDVNRYNSVGVLSPERGQFQAEILAEAKMGHIDSEMVPERIRQQVAALLDGKSPSREPQAEAYRLLVVAVCNFWSSAMPFLFERIADYTELLMPDDLLSGISILAYTREAMTPDVCRDVEVIGWLYQFYISEKKDQVFEGMKKGKKIMPENIPAATQLFTPPFIVRYLVENSLGRLWMLNRPQSKLIEKMYCYIKPEQPETEFRRVSNPEEIKICDPACGSGHMLVYAFDLLYAIYEEEGYPSTEIPEKILSHNLFGIEIDERAGELAAFALTMKARSRNSRFLRSPVLPKICVLENVHFKADELKQYMDFVGRDLFTDPLRSTLRQFEEADNFGSLIRPDLTEVEQVYDALREKDTSGKLYLDPTHKKVLRVLEQAEFLRPKYHVVVANPPYMGGKGMNARLSTWAKDNYSNSKSDLFAMFIERNLELAQKQGLIAMITMQSWMFLSSFESLRGQLLNRNTILSMAHLGTRAFDSIGGEVVSTTAFVLENAHRPHYEGRFVRLIEGRSEAEKGLALQTAVENPNCGWFYRGAAVDFEKIPGSPIVYWASRHVLELFLKQRRLSDRIETREGLTSDSNDLFLRFWYEISTANIGFALTDASAAQKSGKRWFPYVKGGEFRRWSGNSEYLVNWFDDGKELRSFKDEVTGRVRSHNYNGDYAFRSGFTWSGISSGTFAVRHVPPGFMFDAKGPMGFSLTTREQPIHEALLNSVVTNYLLKMLAPTLDFKLGHILKLPLVDNVAKEVEAACARAIQLSLEDWDSAETSWGFSGPLLLIADVRQASLSTTYQLVRVNWAERVRELKQIEEINNLFFIEAYGLQEELRPEVKLAEISLSCNPSYRFGGNLGSEELEALLVGDSMRAFISYAVGCMFGRFALERPGLILADQADTIEKYLEQVPNPGFPPDIDNVIPILDGDWFPDDISERFRKFLRLTFGDEHFEENLNFIEQSIGKTIRTYFVRDFYNDHVKRYKKRPIYWLFSSPKGSFNALIYMHRYRPETVSIILNDYLREFRTKLTSRVDNLKGIEVSAETSKAEKTKALKEIESLRKTIEELSTWERDVLYPLATEKKEIDLDDGVKVNYAKFGAALKKIPGLDVSEE